jgi:hypothetical protein
MSDNDVDNPLSLEGRLSTFVTGMPDLEMRETIIEAGTRFADKARPSYAATLHKVLREPGTVERMKLASMRAGPEAVERTMRGLEARFIKPFLDEAVADLRRSIDDDPRLGQHGVVMVDDDNRPVLGPNKTVRVDPNGRPNLTAAGERLLRQAFLARLEVLAKEDAAAGTA